MTRCRSRTHLGDLKLKGGYVGTKAEIGIRASLPLTDISHFSNVKKTTGTSILTSGTRSWGLRAGAKDGAVAMYQIVCGGHQWGAPTGSLFVRVKKTTFE